MFQPYQALLAAYMGLALYVAGAPRRRVAAVRRALAAAVASQAALLFAYSLWGGVKELAAAWAVALLAALRDPAAEPPGQRLRGAAARVRERGAAGGAELRRASCGWRPC